MHGGLEELGYKQRDRAFHGGYGVDVLIRMNTRILGGWLGSKISAGQSGGGIAFRTIRPISLFFNTKHIYLFISLFSYVFRFPLTNLFIYLFT